MDSSASPPPSSVPTRPAVLVRLRQLWVGRGKPAVRWRSLFGALLALVFASVAYTLALSSLRWQSPLTIIGWGCLALTIALLFLGTRALLNVILQLGVKRLLIRAGIVYIVAVIITGLIIPSGQQGISHWLTSAWGVVGLTASSIGGLLHGLVDMPSALRFASSGERDPVRMPGVAWEGDIPPTPLAVDLIAVSAAEDSSTRPPVADPATPVLPQPDPSLQIGDQVRIVGTDGSALRMRESPSGSSRIVARLPEGSELEIIDGPMQADGRTWWKVKGASSEGWCAADFLARKP